MLLEIGKVVALIFSLLSLYMVMLSGFFVPGSHWQDRLALALGRIVLAAVVCFLSGLLFCPLAELRADPLRRLLATLPVRLFFWSLSAMALLFLLSWYLEEYYVPLLWKNQP